MDGPPLLPLTSDSEPNTISRTHVVSKQAPKLATNKTFTFWRQRSQRRAQAKCVLTAGDRRLQAKKRQEHRRDYCDALREAQGKIHMLAQGLKDRFGKYSVEHYHNDLIHRAHKSRSTRKVNRWNAFQRMELKRIKEEAIGEINLTSVATEISARWRSLSQEDRIAATAGSMRDIEEEREAKDLMLHNVPLRAFYDARSTVQTVEKELSQLYARTGLEFLLIACQSNTKDFMKPFIYHSSEVIKGFITDSLNRSMDNLAVQLEAYVMSGLKGVVMNSKTQLLELKKKTATLILGKLRTLTGADIKRMAYDRFDEQVTAKYHIVVKNWPLNTFCNPSAVATRIELELLHNAWQSGTAYFQKLTCDEMRAWEDARFSARMELMPPPAERVPALTLPQTLLAEKTLFSELPRQDHPDLTPAPSSQNEPLAPVTNLSSATATSRLPAPDPDTIAMMIRADPALQNVDPTLLAMGLADSRRHQGTMAATPPTEQPPDSVSYLGGSKRRWQEVATPLSFDAHTAKKPRRQRKDKNLQNPQAAQAPEN